METAARPAARASLPRQRLGSEPQSLSRALQKQPAQSDGHARLQLKTGQHRAVILCPVSFLESELEPALMERKTSFWVPRSHLAGQRWHPNFLGR